MNGRSLSLEGSVPSLHSYPNRCINFIKDITPALPSEGEGRKKLNLSRLVKTGVQEICYALKRLDSRFHRGNDGIAHFQTFYETIRIGLRG